MRARLQVALASQPRRHTPLLDRDFAHGGDAVGHVRSRESLREDDPQLRQRRNGLRWWRWSVLAPEERRSRERREGSPDDGEDCNSAPDEAHAPATGDGSRPLASL